MNWLGKREAAQEVETDEDRLRILEAEYREAEEASDRAYKAVKVYERVHHVPPSVFIRDGKMFRAMNQRGDPVHQSLLHVAQLRQHARGVKLHAFTEQKIRMGLVK